MDLEQSLVKAHAPILMFHEKEQWYPMEIPQYVSECKIIVPNQPDMNTDSWAEWVALTPGNIQEQSSLRPINFPKPLPFDPAHPIYYTVYKPTPGEMYITYYFFYADNPSSTFLCGCAVPYTSHLADIEHVQVHLQSGVFKRMYFSKHGGGNWVSAEKLSKNDQGRPIVYIGLGSHASYETNGFYGFHCRFGMFVPDKTSEKGIVSESTNVIPIDGALLYRGTYGDGSVSGFPTKSSWMSEDKDESWRCS